MQRNIKDYLTISLKGLGMGAADVVPGVSGGTVAFITGIYEELLRSIKGINFSILQLVLKGEIKQAWEKLNGNFLLSLFIGIAISIVGLSKIILFLLTTYPIIVWSFFFGLIAASAWLVGKGVPKIDTTAIVTFILGAISAYLITDFSPSETPEATWFVFLTGAIAICAMILPGLSGSFILLLMGKYEYILGALKNFDITVIITFAAGCVVGLISFSHLLTFLFNKYRTATIALLAGFMIGSLNKVWPWKEVISTRINSKGKEVPFLENNILPGTYTEITGEENQLTLAVIFALVGFFLIVAMEMLALGKTNKNAA